MLKYFSNLDKQDSLANRLRRKRFKLFLDTINERFGERPLNILDVGGYESFWTTMGFESAKHRITILNLTSGPTTKTNIFSVVGDARAMPQFADQEFDVVFSNSVIEHVGDFFEQTKMAREITRVSKFYFVQTPNFFFPIEPHFLFPGFQFLPKELRAKLHHRFSLGWMGKAVSAEEALANVEQTQLLTKTALQILFPDSKIFRERVAGLTKSLIAIRN